MDYVCFHGSFVRKDDALNRECVLSIGASEIVTASAKKHGMATAPPFVLTEFNCGAMALLPCSVCIAGAERRVERDERREQRGETRAESREQRAEKTEATGDRRQATGDRQGRGERRQRRQTKDERRKTTGDRRQTTEDDRDDRGRQRRQRQPAA